MPKYNNQRCLVRESEKIQELLNMRFYRLKLTGRQITNDARKNGRGFNEGSLSRYRKHGNIKGSLSTEDIIWLCEKYSIKLTLKAVKGR